MQDKPDWFKLYPALFLQDTIVDAMTTEELGATVRLLCRQWMDGHIPDDIDLVGRLCRMNRSAIEQAWPILCQFFPEIEPGKRANRYMWIERETVVSAMAKKRNDGRDAVTKRWNAIRALKETNRSPIADLIQETEQEIEQEEEKKKNTSAPAKRKPKAVAPPAESLESILGGKGSEAYEAYWKIAAVFGPTKNYAPKTSARAFADALSHCGHEVILSKALELKKATSDPKYLPQMTKWISEQGYLNPNQQEANHAPAPQHRRSATDQAYIRQLEARGTTEAVQGLWGGSEGGVLDDPFAV